MTPSERFGEQVRGRRAANGWSQARLAEVSGLAVSEISRLERGQREPRLGTMIRLAQALGLPLAELVRGL